MNGAALTAILIVLGTIIWACILHEPSPRPPADDVLGEMARQRGEDALGHRNLAWPPHGHMPKIPAPPSTPVPPPPARRPTDLELWEQEITE